MKKILFAASECVPFIKTGGLADVVGSLPSALDPAAFDVRVILPKYLCISEKYRSKMEYITHFYTYFNGRNRYLGILKLTLGRITYYFIDNEEYFSGPSPYSDSPIYDCERFAFFSKAVLSVLPSIGFQPDIIHAHDWHTGLIPVFLRSEFASDPWYAGIRTVMTIHNLKFQGTWNIPEIRQITGLDESLFVPDRLEAWGNANYLKGGIVYADRVTTVSPSYAEEVKTPFYGEGLHSLLWSRGCSFSGILNGIDYDEYDPSADTLLPCPYGAEDFRQGKKENKKALQKELGLPADSRVMMIGMVSRLTEQKGLDLISRVLDEILQDALQLVVLGSGDHRYEEMLRGFMYRYPKKLSLTLGYSAELSHRIYGACDAFLMPSLFEPCGLSQLISLRYGTVPIVRETGGLRDTVEPYNEYTNRGTGFSFTNYNAHDMMHTIRYAEQVFYDRKRRWNQIAARAMDKDFSWTVSAEKYAALYTGLTG